ncbi:MAG: hypothetical protein JST68_03400 [Bacteroidetes bacterium]|nr:hypothetical protein [Bacteroidota bacterium]
MNAHVGFRVPGPRVYVAPAPAPVVYQQAPVYQEPVYDDSYAYAPAPINCDPVAFEAEYPGYAYYNYPVWNGHYRDRVYYAHYRPYFMRANAGYYYHGRFDRGRFERERFAHGRGGYRGRW